MTCSACVRHVEQALRGVDGVEKLDVKIGKVRVDHDETKATPQQLIEAIAEAGYEPRITS
ncbi:MAG: heavy-metal-associated domain-containing protein [Labilithrix sp.]|nr:heavy-metal-associated domain-containing protein [Labilithrix sp.]